MPRRTGSWRERSFGRTPVARLRVSGHRAGVNQPMTTLRGRVSVALMLSLLVVAGLLGPAVALAAPIDTSGLEFSALRSFGLPFVPGGDFFLSVRRTVPVGPLEYFELVGDTAESLGVPTWQPGGTVNGVDIFDATLPVDGPSAGSHVYQAVFAATDTLDALTLEVTVDVEPVAMTVAITTAANPVQANHGVTLTPELSGEGTGTAITGTIEWRNADTDAVLDTRSVDDPALDLGPLAVGIRHYVAEYSGDSDHAGATSPVFTLTVVADTVDASGVGLQYTTFYPPADGYRDTVAIKGVRDEPSSVSIRVYGPTGSLVRSASIGSGSGPYAYAWNGRSSTGVILANGKYKVVQTLTDTAGSKRAFTAYVTLSNKRLYTYTTYVTKLGSALSAKGAGSGGSVTTSSSAGYAKVSSGSGGWALAGWEFVVPSATIYKSLTFQVYAKAVLSAPPTSIAMQDFTECARASLWNDTCFDRYRGIGNATGALAWFQTGSTSAANRSGRYVRGLVAAGHGSTYVYKARVKVVYQLLR